MSDVKFTGLADLDNLLSTPIGNEPMPIDKNMFDAIILPLLMDDLKSEKPLTVDERFEHLKNIWINYYREHAKKNNLAIDANAVPTRDPRTPVKAITSNGVFHPMVIIDIEGNVVDTTPPLLEPFIVENTTEAALQYNANPMSSSGLLLDVITNGNKSFINDNKNSWSAFLDRYYGKSVEKSEETESPYSLGEE